jgi:hypothetical protein
MSSIGRAEEHHIIVDTSRGECVGVVRNAKKSSSGHTNSYV